MPATIHKIFPGLPEKFDRWLEPGDEPSYGYLLMPGIAAVKLYVVYCPPNDAVTAVYEKGLPIAITPDEVEERKVEFFKAFDFTNPDELLPWDKPHTIRLDDRVQDMGVRVTHRAYRSRQFE